MNVNVTLLMTITCAARIAFAVVDRPGAGGAAGVSSVAAGEAGSGVSLPKSVWRPYSGAARRRMQNAASAFSRLANCPPSGGRALWLANRNPAIVRLTAQPRQGTAEGRELDDS